MLQLEQEIAAASGPAGMLRPCVAAEAADRAEAHPDDFGVRAE